MSLVKSENQFNTKMQVGIPNLTILNSMLLLTHSTVHYQKILSKKFSTKNYKLKNGTLASSEKLWVKVQNKCLLIIWIIYSLNHSINKTLYLLHLFLQGVYSIQMIQRICTFPDSSHLKS